VVGEDKWNTKTARAARIGAAPLYARPYSNCVSSTFQLNQFPSADGGMDWKGAEIVDLVCLGIDCRATVFSEVSLCPSLNGSEKQQRKKFCVHAAGSKL
jgi:hypothetical protein